MAPEFTTDTQLKLWLSCMWAQQTSLLWVVSLISVSFSNSTLCSSSKIHFEMTPSTEQATFLAYSSWRHLTKYWFPHAVVPFSFFVTRRVFVSGTQNSGITWQETTSLQRFGNSFWQTRQKFLMWLHEQCMHVTVMFQHMMQPCFYNCRMVTFCKFG